MKEENKFIKRVFPRPVLLNEPPKKGRIWILDILIAYLLFTIAEIPISVITTPVISAYILNNIDFRAVAPKFDSVTIRGIIDYFKQMFDSVSRIMESFPAWIWLLMLFTFAFITLIVIIFRVKIEKGTLYSLGIKKKGAVKSYALGMLIGFAVLSLAVLLSMLTGELKFAEFCAPTVSNTVYIILFLLGYFVQGMAEEVLCRGFLMTALSRRYSVLTAVLVNSAFFMLMHALNPGINLIAFFDLFLYGVFASLVMIKTDNIWVVSAIHTMWNFTLGNIYGISVSGSAVTPSVMRCISVTSDFGAEGDFGTLIAMTIGIAIVALIKPKEKAEQ